MQIREHRGFTIQVYESGAGYVSEIYRKGKLIRTVYNENGQDSQIGSLCLLIEAAKDWIDRTFSPWRIKYFGEV